MIDVELTNKSGITLATNGKYCADNITVTPRDADNIIPENIKKDVEILGVTGSLELSGTDNAVSEFIAGQFEEYTTPNIPLYIRSGSFGYMTKLKKLVLSNVAYCTGAIFYTPWTGANPIEELYILSADTTRVSHTTTGNSQTFAACPKLKKVYLCKDFVFNQFGGNDFVKDTAMVDFQVEAGFHSLLLDISPSTLFSRETLVNILNNYADMTGKTTAKVIFGSTNLAKLTDEDKLIATNKNITLAQGANMVLTEENGLRILLPEDKNNVITDVDTETMRAQKLYLGKNDSVENYKEIDKDTPLPDDELSAEEQLEKISEVFADE